MTQCRNFRSVFMRCILLLFMLTGILRLYAQADNPKNGEQQITIADKKLTILKVFKLIERQTGLRFNYRPEQINLNEKISLGYKTESLNKVLTDILKSKGFIWKFLDNVIVLQLEGNSVKDVIMPSPDSIPDTIPKTVTGQVLDNKGQPIAGATVSLKGQSRGQGTNIEGKFSFANIPSNATLVVSSIGFESKLIRLAGQNEVRISLEPLVREIQAVEVISTGYQTTPKERATGAFEFIDNKLINRSVTTNILDRIENLVPGVLFNKGDASKTDPLLIRGRSTIYGASKGNQISAAPLIVLDNFPYDGELGNINPNDIATISILKDAAAASIWGARAANGVIVVTTKRGTSNKPRIEFNSNVTVQGRPDFGSLNMASGTDFIELEKHLFDKGYYSGRENDPNKSPLTPVVELLIKKRDNPALATEIDAQIEALKKHDIRNDISKYLYRTSVNQQYALNVSGNTPVINYYMSGGYDRNLPSLQGTQFDRITLRSQNTFKLSDKFQVDFGLNYMQSIDKSGNNIGYSKANGSLFYYPYARLVNDDGTPVPYYDNYRQQFLETAKSAGLLDWTYNPITDRNEVENSNKIRDFLLNTAMRYRITKHLNADLKYQYENQLTTGQLLNKPGSYYARDMINRYTQKSVAGVLTYPIPKGGIVNNINGEVVSHQARMQLNYNQTFDALHQIAAIAGYEIRSYVSTSNSGITYGYDPENLITTNTLDFITRFPQYQNPFVTATISNSKSLSKYTDHFLSYYANASYTFKERYIISGSARKDEANLFGVKANQKGAPFWSIGGAWIISNENLFQNAWFTLLKLRTTYGYNGNISRKASAHTTAANFVSNTTLPFAAIKNPPNENLKWEQVGVFNIAVDFEIRNKVLSGSIDYYRKNAKGLMAEAPIDPTLGIGSLDAPSFFGNVANMSGSGIDLQMHSINLDGNFKWYTSLIYSHTISKLDQYLMPISSNGSIYITPGITPIIGKPLYSMYSYRWSGLNPVNGEPRGYVEGKPSNEYGKIFTTPLDSLKYNGNVQPTDYGALRNTLAYKAFSLSFNISYKFNYYFRNNFIGYASVGAGVLDKQFSQRWQKSGDELITNAPSFAYPFDSQRDLFYNNSEVSVKKADNIRLEDVNISYDVSKQVFKKLPVSSIRLYMYASNLGMLWAANKEGVDPYYNNVPVEAKRFAFGASVGF